MANFLKKRWVMFVVAVLVITVVVGISLYRDSLTRMLDKAAYSDLSNAIKESAEEGAFTSQSSLQEYITKWADENSLEYKTDKSGNIIFSRSATERKKKISPTVVCVSYNYETAKENSRLLAGAAMIALYILITAVHLIFPIHLSGKRILLSKSRQAVMSRNVILQ